MLNHIPFEIPAELLAKVSTGELVRFGSILKDAATGRIVAHVQETGLAHSLLSTVAAGIPTPFTMVSELINLATGIQVARQVNQLRVLIGTLQALQVATLGATLLGVGVSVAGFIHVHRRMNALDGRMKKILDVVQAGFEDQRKWAIGKQLAQVKSLMDRARNAATLQNPTVEYREIGALLADQAAFFDHEIKLVVSMPGKVSLTMLRQLAQALMDCNALRIDCQIRNNELRHALAISEDVAAQYQLLFNPLTPLSFDGDIQQGSEAIKVLRESTDASATKPYLIDQLRTRSFGGDRYLAALEQEREHPLLILNHR
ncbi:hypothetical protein [uncultured Pseudacidovorax sp.]|uniref:hypothetical protein n=1 Tax=uncultured Pseudacidovorax sp. TaxID=679313 RepID=UPI0025F5569C|nr:hypothetical protein [uncultured Pseudacidovorax sp.]